MCAIDSSVKDVIETVVELWSSQSRAFTSYEVSLEVQARLKEKGQPFVRHSEMVDYYRHNECQSLQNVLGDGSYKATLRSVGSNLEAFVYHPSNYDPTNYNPLPRNKNTGVLPAQVPHANLVTSVVSVPPVLLSITAPPHSNGNTISSKVATSVVKASNGVYDPNVAEVNKSGELWVGCGHIQTAGFNAGDAVTITLGNGEVIITAFDPTKDGYLIKRKVEKYGNLRLYLNERTKSGFIGNRFKLESQPGKIVIKEV